MSGIFINVSEGGIRLSLRKLVFLDAIIAINEAVLFVANFESISVRIVTENRICILYLKYWSSIKEKLIKELFPSYQELAYSVRYQLTPLHVFVYNNEDTDIIAKKGYALPGRKTLTLCVSDIQSLNKIRTNINKWDSIFTTVSLRND